KALLVLNKAAALLKLDKFKEVVEETSKVIEELTEGESKWRGLVLKALFRRGKAWIGLREWTKARADIEKVKEALARDEEGNVEEVDKLLEEIAEKEKGN